MAQVNDGESGQSLRKEGVEKRGKPAVYCMRLRGVWRAAARACWFPIGLWSPENKPRCSVWIMCLQIEERWGIFLARFELMGEMNPEFVRQTDEYLEKLKFKSVQVRDIHNLLNILVYNMHSAP